MSCRSPLTVPIMTTPFVAPSAEMRAKQGGSGVHRAGGDEDFRNEDFVVLKFFADDIHAGDKSFFKNLLRFYAFFERESYVFLNLCRSSRLQSYADVFKYSHCNSLLF